MITLSPTFFVETQIAPAKRPKTTTSEQIQKETQKQTPSFVIEPTAAERQSTKKLTANDHRVRLEAMKHAEKIMSKSLNASMPNHESWLIQRLKIVFACRERRMKKQPFMFESTRKFSHHNTKTLQRFGGDYKNLVSHYGGSILTPGSEFRSI